MIVDFSRIPEIKGSFPDFIVNISYGLDILFNFFNTSAGEFSVFIYGAEQALIPGTIPGKPQE